MRIACLVGPYHAPPAGLRGAYNGQQRRPNESGGQRGGEDSDLFETVTAKRSLRRAALRG